MGPSNTVSIQCDFRSAMRVRVPPFTLVSLPAYNSGIRRTNVKVPLPGEVPLSPPSSRKFPLCAWAQWLRWHLDYMRRSLPPPASSERGVTLIDIQVGLALFAILAAMTVVSVQTAMTTARGDSAMMQVVGAFRQGREAAIAYRRGVDIRFVDPNRVQLWRLDPDDEVLLLDLPLDYGSTFQLGDGIPDTPDTFGNESAIDFGGAETIRFVPDSTLTAGDGIPLNGTVFFMRTGEPFSARAVTISGGSGRAQAYRWSGSQWEAR